MSAGGPSPLLAAGLRPFLGGPLPGTGQTHVRKPPQAAEMESAVWKAKKRVLPPWMAVREVEPRKTRSAVRFKRAKKPAVARTVTVYCMNEAELVDVALGVLAENCKYKEMEGNIPSETEGEQEGQQTPTEPQWSPASSGGASTPRPGPEPHAQPDALGCASRTDTEDDEDDALKYVREIFFS
ncbi:cell cycle regulator of non-homologous end joining isoform X1 [Eretmochelys imbricata]